MAAGRYQTFIGVSRNVTEDRGGGGKEGDHRAKGAVLIDGYRANINMQNLIMEMHSS